MTKISIPTEQLLWRTRGRHWEYCFLLTPEIDRGSWWRFYREVKAELNLSKAGDQAMGKLKDRAGNEHYYLASIYLDSRLVDAAGRETEQFVVWFCPDLPYPPSCPANLAKSVAEHFGDLIQSNALRELTDNDETGADTVFHTLRMNAGLKNLEVAVSPSPDCRLIDVYHQADGDLVVIKKKKRAITPLILLFIFGTLLTILTMLYLGH